MKKADFIDFNEEITGELNKSYTLYRYRINMIRLYGWVLTFNMHRRVNSANISLSISGASNAVHTQNDGAYRHGHCTNIALNRTLLYVDMITRWKFIAKIYTT